MDEEERRASEEYIQTLLAEEEQLLQEEQSRREDDERLARLLSDQLVSVSHSKHGVTSELVQAGPCRSRLDLFSLSASAEVAFGPAG